jgi:hypothetical protein
MRYYFSPNYCTVPFNRHGSQKLLGGRGGLVHTLEQDVVMI